MRGYMIDRAFILVCLALLCATILMTARHLDRWAQALVAERVDANQTSPVMVTIICDGEVAYNISPDGVLVERTRE